MIAAIVIMHTDVQYDCSFEEIGYDPIEALLLDVIDGVSPVPDISTANIGYKAFILLDELRASVEGAHNQAWKSYHFEGNEPSQNASQQCVWPLERAEYPPVAPVCRVQISRSEEKGVW